MNKTNTKVLRKGQWTIRWRQRLLFVLLAALSGTALYQQWIEWLPAILVPLGGIPLLLLLSMRSVARWKMNNLLQAENPKVVLGQARRSFLKGSFPEEFTLWTPGERTAFHEAYDKRMLEVREEQLRHGEELFAGRSKIHVHQALGVVPAWTLIGFIGLFACLIWFRLRADVTERVIASILFLSFVWLSVSMIRILFRRNKDVVFMNRHGIRIEGTHYPWQDLELVDVDAGMDLIVKVRNGEIHRKNVKGLSLSPNEIEEAALYFKQLLEKEALEKA